METRYEAQRNPVGVMLTIDGHVMPISAIIDKEKNVILGVGTNHNNAEHLASAANFSHKPRDYGYKLVQDD